MTAAPTPEAPPISSAATPTRQRGTPLVTKRILDVVLAAIAVLVSAPLMGVIAVAIKVETRGPALYRAERVGRNGQRFNVLKFRTMQVSADPASHRAFVLDLLREGPYHAVERNETALYKLVDDPRVTGVGRLLRRTSLDELPQLFNVLRGDMSLVGPRPEVPYVLDAYPPWALDRFSVLPGITGAWQVSGRSKLTPLEMLRLDSEYARTWSIGRDVRILLATPRAILAQGGAA